MNIMTRAEAKEVGEKFYYTGKLCKHGHDAVRYVSNTSCYECHKRNMRTYYDKNSNKLKQYGREHYDNNREYYLNWISENKEHTIQYRRKNKEHIAAIKRKYNEENRDKVRFWNSKRRAQHLRAMPSWVNEEEIKEIYKLQQELIKDGYDVQVDHIIPLNSDIVSGLHCPDNLIIIPSELNRLKSNTFFPELGMGKVTVETIEKVVLNKDSQILEE